MASDVRHERRPHFCGVPRLSQLLREDAAKRAGTRAVQVPFIALKCYYLDDTRIIYEALGCRFTAEQHGDGPLHYSASVGSLVLELYPQRESAPRDHGITLGLQVADVGDSFIAAVNAGADPVSEPANGRAILKDRAGNTVILSNEVL